jgi:hypothetical protein
MTLEVPSWVGETARMLPYPLLFATVSGAHLYGFSTPTSQDPATSIRPTIPPAASAFTSG